MRTFKAKLEGSNAVYAQTTIKGTPQFLGKKEKSQDWKHLTLKDSGDFRKTFKVDVFQDFFRVDGDENKPDGKISDNVNLTNVYNLSEVNTNKLIAFIKPRFYFELHRIANI